jgi:hypothetical protein
MALSTILDVKPGKRLRVGAGPWLPQGQLVRRSLAVEQDEGRRPLGNGPGLFDVTELAEGALSSPIEDAPHRLGAQAGHAEQLSREARFSSTGKSSG